MEIKRISHAFNNKNLDNILDSLKESYYLSREDILNDYYKWNLYGMFDRDTLLCSCTIEEYDEFVFMKRFVMVGEYGNQYFKKMVKLWLEVEPHICLTIAHDNYKVAKILKDLNFTYVGDVMDKTGTYTYELHQGG